MKQSSIQIKKNAHKFGQFAWMRFRPLSINYLQPSLSQNKQSDNSFFSRLKSMILPVSSQVKTKYQSKAQTEEDLIFNSIKSQHIPGRTLKYFIKMSNQHFIIGNQNQIDLIKIQGFMGQQMQTSHLWSINLGQGQCIDLISINLKKPFIALYSNMKKSILVYKYSQDPENKSPQLYISLVTKNIVKFLYFVKELNLAVFYEDFCEVYVFQNQNRTMRRRFIKQYVKQMPKSNPQNVTVYNPELLTVSQPFSGSINIFLCFSKQNQPSFELYLIEMNLLSSTITMSLPKKIYNIKKGLKNLINIQNYSQQIFLLNIGFQLFAVMKKGYIIDSANVNLHKQKSTLKYLGNNILIHISEHKIQQYQFVVNVSKTPYKIMLKSLDSIQIKYFENFSYFSILPIECVNSKQKNYLMSYQVKNDKNKKSNGEIQYKLAMTKLIKIQEKIKDIFHFQGKNLTNVTIQQIQEKVDMATKIGLQKKDIYLELWNRTNKNTLQDYRFLLDTLHYQTICREIQKKLKKQSMPFTQVYKIQSSCLNMLKAKVLSKQCNDQYLRNYVCSHFKLRKYEFFRDISMIYSKLTKSKNVQEQKKFMIDIQAYYTYTQIQLKSYFLQKIYHYLFQIQPQNSKYGKAETLFQIKILLNAFRFQYKIIYEQIIEEVINLAKGSSILTLINDFPELLPYIGIHQDKQIESSNDMPTIQWSKAYSTTVTSKQREQFFMELINCQNKMFGGVWPDIIGTEWQKGLYMDNIVTIQNKLIVNQFIHSVWFQRNIYSQHDFITKTKEQIMKIHSKLKSDYFFYNFIDKIYKLITDSKIRMEVIKLLQKKYPALPEHLKGKVHLYRRLYQKLKEIRYQREHHTVLHENIFEKILSRQKNVQIVPLFDGQNIQKFESFNQFLNLKDEELFKQFVRLQKNVIGTVFHKIKPVYEEFENGRELFNNSVQNYFRSPISQVTDLKYLLNRLNSQERQFQDQHTSLYQVLVKAVMMKLRVGKFVPPQDYVDIQQLIVYIQNISYSKKTCKKIKKLKSFNDLLTNSQKNYSQKQQTQQLLKDYFDVINGLQEQKQLFNQLSINKSIYQIYQNPDSILPKIIDTQITKHHVYQIEEYQEFLNSSYEILVEINSLLKDIFHLNNGNQVLVYLWRVIEEEKFLYRGFIKKILDDAFIIKYYNVDIYMRQNLVLYLYKYNFSKQVDYCKNINFLECILQFLPPDNKYHKFITAQKQLAKILSTKDQPITYPITQNHQIISVYHLQLIINRLPGEFLLQMDLQKLCKIVNEMQQQIWKQLIQDAQKQYQQEKMKDFMQIQELCSYHVQNIEDSIQFGGIDLKNIEQIKNVGHQRQQKQLLFSRSQKIQTKHLQTSISQIYQLIIKRLIDCLLIKQCIPLLEKLFKISSNKLFIIYPLMILDAMSTQLVEQQKFSLVKIACYLFRQPKQLLRVIKDLITNKYSQKQLQLFLQVQLQKASQVQVSLHKKTSIDQPLQITSPLYKRKNNLQLKISQSQQSIEVSNSSKKRQKLSRRNYSNDNPLIDQAYLSSIRNQKIKQNFIKLVWKTFQNIKQSKTEFKEFQYQLINVMLFQQPYTLAKYLNMKKHTIDFKELRSYFSQVIRQPIFNPVRLLQFGRRIFTIIYGSIKQCSSLQNKLKEYYDISLYEDLQFPITMNKDQIFNQIQIKLQKSAEAFEKKKKKLFNQLKNNKYCENPALKLQRIQQQLSDPTNKNLISRTQYRYPNFDDNLQEQPKKKQSPLKRKLTVQLKQFDPLEEQNLIMSRGGKNLSLILGNSDAHQSLKFTLRGKLSPKSNAQNIQKNRIKGKKTFDDIFFGRQKTQESIVIEQQFACSQKSFQLQNTDKNQFSPGSDDFFYKSQVVKPKKYSSNEKKNLKGVNEDALCSPNLFQYKRKSHDVQRNSDSPQSIKRKSAQNLQYNFQPPLEMSQSLQESIVLSEQIIQSKSLAKEQNGSNIKEQTDNHIRDSKANKIKKKVQENRKHYETDMEFSSSQFQQNKQTDKSHSQVKVQFQQENSLPDKKDYSGLDQDQQNELTEFQKITQNISSKLESPRKSRTMTTQYQKVNLVVNVTQPNKKMKHSNNGSQVKHIQQPQPIKKTELKTNLPQNVLKTNPNIPIKQQIKKTQQPKSKLYKTQNIIENKIETQIKKPQQKNKKNLVLVVKQIQKKNYHKEQQNLHKNQNATKHQSRFKLTSSIKLVINVEQLAQKLISENKNIMEVITLIEANQTFQVSLEMLKAIQQDQLINLQPILHLYNTKWSKQPKNKELQNPYKSFFQQVLQQLFAKYPIEVIIPLLINVRSKIDCPLSQDGLDYYYKFITFNIKCKSQLNLKVLLSYEGLFLQSKQEIFKKIQQNLVNYSNENNVYKLSTMINMVFKYLSFENQFFYLYLLKIIPQIELLIKKQSEQSQKRFITSSTSKLKSPLEVANQQLQHFTQNLDGILMKIPINILIFHKKDILLKIQKGDNGRNQLLQVMKKSIFKRKGDKAAQQFYQKAIHLCQK